MHHNFFILSSVDGHLDCFHVLPTVNSVAMNIPPCSLIDKSNICNNMLLSVIL